MADYADALILIWNGQSKGSANMLKLAHGKSKGLSLEDVFVLAEKGECVLQQWTGIKDKDGREIYEGDIISFDVYEYHDQNLDHISNAEVWWDNEHLIWCFGRFKNDMYSPAYEYDYDMTSGIKKDSFLVTANIFKNPIDKPSPLA